VDLCDKIRDMAEGYALTDPRYAWQYRQEAEEFCRAEPTQTADEHEVREALAKTLRSRWGERISRLSNAE